MLSHTCLRVRANFRHLWIQPSTPPPITATWLLDQTDRNWERQIKADSVYHMAEMCLYFNQSISILFFTFWRRHSPLSTARPVVTIELLKYISAILVKLLLFPISSQGFSYKFRVRALNILGESEPSAASRPYVVSGHNNRVYERPVAGPYITFTDAINETTIMLKWMVSFVGEKEGTLQEANV